MRSATHRRWGHPQAKSWCMRRFGTFEILSRHMYIVAIPATAAAWSMKSRAQTRIPTSTGPPMPGSWTESTSPKPVWLCTLVCVKLRGLLSWEHFPGGLTKLANAASQPPSTWGSFTGRKGPCLPLSTIFCDTSRTCHSGLSLTSSQNAGREGQRLF